jgi:soluble lytic murein transglycosylase-like protein
MLAQQVPAVPAGVAQPGVSPCARGRRWVPAKRTWRTTGLVENTFGVPLNCFKAGQHALRSVNVSVCWLLALLLSAQADDAVDRAAIDRLITKHASAYGVPESLVHRVVQNESKYVPGASQRGSYGLMQISYGTAQGMGYIGPAAGLLDADTNLSYGVLYLAKAYRAAAGDQDRAVRLYKRGF